MKRKQIGRQKDRVALWMKKNNNSICMTINNHCIVWAEIDRCWWEYDKSLTETSLEKEWKWTYKLYDFMGYIK